MVLSDSDDWSEHRAVSSDQVRNIAHVLDDADVLDVGLDEVPRTTTAGRPSLADKALSRLLGAPTEGVVAIRLV